MAEVVDWVRVGCNGTWKGACLGSNLKLDMGRGIRGKLHTENASKPNFRCRDVPSQFVAAVLVAKSLNRDSTRHGHVLLTATSSPCIPPRQLKSDVEQNLLSNFLSPTYPFFTFSWTFIPQLGLEKQGVRLILDGYLISGSIVRRSLIPTIY
ncbi:hypothetical protein K469DRAFT_717312 [Zopfia rhizophila CBS 207.26]|uniref:Uncharacterized protein n=1 Tax=Zopfia rhizophila CBS 207.26 TaxID=1314779 RepID=A0A6A6EP27_9PEZI|nr:hypothetical protein K469DRAFT_717312 [Zopfia rhizophila CBS 207.26]